MGCGETFRAIHSYNKFCNRSCFLETRSVLVEHTCLNPECASTTKNPKFCSRSCAVAVNNSTPKRTAKGRECSGCGNLTRASNIYYCGDPCRDLKNQRRLDLGEYSRLPKTPKWDNQLYQIWLSGSIAPFTSSSGELLESARALLLRVRGARCVDCGWCEVHPITGRVPVTVDHIDGDARNNDLSNLQVLCPNHHSLTPTYGSLNTKNSRVKNGMAPLDRMYARIDRKRLP